MGISGSLRRVRGAGAAIHLVAAALLLLLACCGRRRWCCAPRELFLQKKPGAYLPHVVEQHPPRGYSRVPVGAAAAAASLSLQTAHSGAAAMEWSYSDVSSADVLYQVYSDSQSTEQYQFDQLIVFLFVVVHIFGFMRSPFNPYRRQVGEVFKAAGLGDVWRAMLGPTGLASQARSDHAS